MAMLPLIDECKKNINEFTKNSESNGISNCVLDILDSLWYIGVRNQGKVLEGLFCLFAHEIGKRWGFKSDNQPKLKKIKSKKVGDFSWTKNGKTVHFEIKAFIENGKGPQSIEKLSQCKKEIEKNKNNLFLLVGCDAYRPTVLKLNERKEELSKWIFIRRENTEKPDNKDNYEYVEEPDHPWVTNKSKSYWYRIYEEFSGKSFIEKSFLKAREFLTR